jgi:pimeloyl-ACP methyl ester carboxylesterase
MGPIVMVHGAFVGGWSFERFEQPFRDAGYEVHAPDLRGHGADEPADEVIGVSMRDYLSDIVALCRQLPEPPILLGHSMGGLVAQMAARAANAQALVLLAPSPPWGLVSWTLEEAMASLGAHLATLMSNGAIEPSQEIMRFMSLARMSAGEAEPILARLRPESALAVRETVCWWLDPFMTTSIGAGPLPMPGLVLTGQEDRVNPASVGREIAARIGAEFEAVPQMEHWLVGEPGWDGVAARVLDWLHADARAAA